MAWCDPCAADPLTPDELRRAGVFWQEGEAARGRVPGQVLLTRLHVRYDAEHFPEDLAFRETADRENFQGRYVLRHPFKGKADCPEGGRYRETLRDRQESECRTLASLTGWDLADIRKKAGLSAHPVADPWWHRVFE
jgi:hypothetical protein